MPKKASRRSRVVIWIGSALLFVGSLPTAADELRVPTIKEVLGTHRVAGPVLSPDGSAIVYSRQAADWESNQLDSELWLARRDAPPFQLTRTDKGGSNGAAWSPDGRWISFLADRGHGRQIHLISPSGGEARPLTRIQGGVETYDWGPDATFLVLRLRDPESKEDQAQTKAFGRFFQEDDKPRPSHLWWLDVEASLNDPATLPAETAESEEKAESEPGKKEGETSPSPRRLTSGDFTVDDFNVSPDGKSVVFSRRAERRITARAETDLSIVDLAPDGKVRTLVDDAGPDDSPVFSPDGRFVAYSTSGGDFAFYKNAHLAVVPADGGEPRLLAEDYDGSPRLVEWTSEGILWHDWKRTERRFHLLDPETGEFETLDHLPPISWGASPSADGRTLAVYGQTPDTLAEIWRCDLRSSCEEVTEAGAQLAGWALGHRRTVQWKSRDGLDIEGVLHTPDGFDPRKKHPLLVVIHGGPAAVSYPDNLPGYVYPVAQFLGKGAVVLMPNYRGSDGYGEAFRSANVDRLGVADAWDVLSGVDHLVAQGFVDEERMGVMGWSQGGYISAFLATTSDRFRGISVGAGISNWTTYYANTDIPTFTRQYLSATPWDDPELYAETSPITYLQSAKTPTLIQHGENDKRVPIPNAYELYRGLRDMGVPSELIVYEDFGHGIGRPKERLAAALHNWRWFLHTVWGEPLNLFLEEPKDESEEKDGEETPEDGEEPADDEEYP